MILNQEIKHTYNGNEYIFIALDGKDVTWKEIPHDSYYFRGMVYKGGMTAYCFFDEKKLTIDSIERNGKWSYLDWICGCFDHHLGLKILKENSPQRTGS